MKPSQLLLESLKRGGLDHIDERDALLMEEVAEKLVRFGQRMGMTPEEMISLLDSGISIRDLLAFLVSRCSGAA